MVLSFRDAFECISQLATMLLLPLTPCEIRRGGESRVIMNKEKIRFQRRQGEIFKMYRFNVIVSNGAVQFPKGGPRYLIKIQRNCGGDSEDETFFLCC